MDLPKKTGKMNTSKFDLFLENARLLSDKLGIVPLLYGSLGLEYLTSDDLDADDIDILVPRVFIIERWQEFKEVLEEQGYALVDACEHTFVRDGVAYSYADIEDLESFAGIRIADIEVREADGVRFLLLSLEQYFAVYQKSSKDGYRVNVRQKKDVDKIKFIESKLIEARCTKMDKQALYELLRTIPHGKVVTYGTLAQMLGNRAWARAVGNVLHANPDGEKYPCYKVVNSKGELSNAYAFGGVEEQKRRLLQDGVAVLNDRVDLKKYGYRMTEND